MYPTSRIILVSFVVGLSGCLFDTSDSEYGEVPRAGGDLTLFQGTSNSFSTPAPGLSEENLELHLDGDAGFEAKFVTGGQVNPGLGPLFNNISCVACHKKDGRGRPPESGEILSTMLFRISVPGIDEHGGPKAMPGYGGQIQPRAIAGEVPEVNIKFSYRDSSVSLANKESIPLRVPTYTLENPWFPFSQTPLISPRVTPTIIGLGLLEAVDEATILDQADPYDQNHDGISGKPNYVYQVRTNSMVLGRFGLKANNPNLEQQSAGAYNQDMGITNVVFRDENCAGDRPSCVSVKPDVDSATLAAVVFYVRSLAVPGRRNWQSAEVHRGEKLFTSIGCATCHLPELKTGLVPERPFLSNQTIHPYTDLLVHDMGPGLADNRPDFDANGQEWRTTPLWGLGLTKVVNGHTLLLHDGRARNMMEAILWHGGEGERSKNAVRNLPKSDQQALLTFLESL